MAETLVLRPVAVAVATQQALSPLNPRYQGPTGSVAHSATNGRVRRRDTSPLRGSRRDEAVDDKLHDFSASAVVSHQAVANRLKALAQLSHGEIARVLLNAPEHAQMQRVAHSHDTVLMLADRGNRLHALDAGHAYLDRARKALHADASDLLLEMQVAGHRVLTVAGFGNGAKATDNAALAQAQRGPSTAPPFWLVARNLGAEAAGATRQHNPMASQSARLLADVGATGHVLAKGQIMAIVPEDVASLQLAVGKDEQKLISGRYGLMVETAAEAPAALPKRPTPREMAYGEDERVFASWEAIDASVAPKRKLGGRKAEKPLTKVVRHALAEQTQGFRQTLAEVTQRNGVMARLVPIYPNPLPWQRMRNDSPVQFFSDNAETRAYFAAEDLAAHARVVGGLNLDQDARLQAVPPQTSGAFGNKH